MESSAMCDNDCIKTNLYPVHIERFMPTCVRLHFRIRRHTLVRIRVCGSSFELAPQRIMTGLLLKDNKFYWKIVSHIFDQHRHRGTDLLF